MATIPPTQTTTGPVQPSIDQQQTTNPTQPQPKPQPAKPITDKSDVKEPVDDQAKQTKKKKKKKKKKHRRPPPYPKDLYPDMMGGGGGGIQVLRKGARNPDGTHNIDQIGGNFKGKKGVQIHTVDDDGVYRDADGNIAIDPDDKKTLLHLQRRGFYYKKRLIFEWIQTLEDVTLYIIPPKNIGAKHLNISFSSNHLLIGIKNMKPFINDKLSYNIDSISSTWFIDDEGLCVSLTKLNIGEAWYRVIDRQQPMNTFEGQKIKKSMMLERFARENPHMDFSGAQFGGQCPEPTKFLDGINTNRFHKDVQ